MPTWESKYASNIPTRIDIQIIILIFITTKVNHILTLIIFLCKSTVDIEFVSSRKSLLVVHRD